MKTITALAAFSALLFTTGLVLPGRANANLVGHWAFDESSGSTTADSSANHDNGTLFGSVLPTFVAGKAGNAISLNSSNGQYIYIGNVIDFSGNVEFTVSAWIQTTTSSNGAVVYKQQYGYRSGYCMTINGSGPYGAPNKADFYGSSSGYNGVTGTSNINDGAWHQIVGTYKAGGLLTIYVDGKLENSTASESMIGSSYPLLFGAYYNGGAVPTFNGLIDDVQIYDNALSATQIGYLYSNPGQVVPEPSSMILTMIGFLAALAFGNRIRCSG